MGGVFGRRAVPRTGVGAVLAALAVGLVACGAPEPDPTAVPTFPTGGQSAGPSAGPGGDASTIPKDCARILAAGDLEAVLGLPLGTVTVRTTLGVPEPSVERTERVSCAYNRNGSGGDLLDVNATAYADPDAASAQWRINVDAESGDRRDVPLGGASAVLFERPEEAVLMVAYSTSNLTVQLPQQPLPGGRGSGDVLVDLALRMIPSVSTPAPTPSAVPPPSAPTATPASRAVGTW